MTTPVPLPPEEIERLKTRMRNPFDAGCNCNVDAIDPWFHDDLCRRRIFRHTIPALLAEIEAGRADGAKRVQELEMQVTRLRPVVQAALAWESRKLSDGALEAVISAYIAALRQAAQPSDGARTVRRMIGADIGLYHDDSIQGSGYRQLYRPAVPAQIDAQPAGRVEPKRKTLDELQAEFADVERQISEATSWGAGLATSWGAGLAALDEWRRDLKREIARATLPTAGAVDDKEPQS
jgi:hypothetical protein